MTKNVLIIGANSRIAQWADKMLLADENVNLTMFVRNKAKLDSELQDQNVIVGDATNSADLEAAIEGQDIVYVSLAGNVVDQAKKIVAAMDKQGVKRLIWTSSLGIYDEVPGKFGELNTRALPGYLQTYREAADVISNSDLDYTIIRPAWLTNNDEVDYETTSYNNGEAFKGTEISRKSVAAYVVSLVNDPEQDVRDSIGVDKPGSDGDRPRREVMMANGFDPEM
ncbi:NAD(P)H-binding protein [Limosilactobacillus oris]|uniref:NAD(P)H-binding protein n=1 Tax=Limosilactobacillus oris TaxID=1632 RepID=UPI0022361C62|nr:NAD(P)H-binding protein [Limosilactobacillus oris]MCW4388515.1 NAD(P)H-binding protein [Limosilactobacillus oris]